MVDPLAAVAEVAAAAAVVETDRAVHLTLSGALIFKCGAQSEMNSGEWGDGL